LKNLIFTIGAGHCNNEYTSWLLNHSPDTGNRQRYKWTPYESEWGTHHRSADDWMLEQYDEDDNQPMRHNILRGYTHTGLRNPDFPHFLKRKLLDKWVVRLCQLHKHDAMSVYLNVLDVSDSIDFIKSKASDWGIDVHFVTSYWDFEYCPVRHYYIMMEFDPTSTDEDHPDTPIDLDFMCASIIDRHNVQSSIVKYQDKLDLIAFQSETDTTHWFEKVGLKPPHNMQRIIEHYRSLNKPTSDMLKKLNTLSWKEIEERYWKCENWNTFQRKISQNGTTDFFKKLIAPRLIDK
tara:strand:+ start:4904 stop:5779 length:876 start_codon:yes stop_codon:yes gene_type:complete